MSLAKALKNKKLFWYLNETRERKIMKILIYFFAAKY